MGFLVLLLTEKRSVGSGGSVVVVVVVVGVGDLSPRSDSNDRERDWTKLEPWQSQNALKVPGGRMMCVCYLCQFGHRLRRGSRRGCSVG